MKRTELLKKNNKGAALISILIAITFVSIIATTLLMISLNNYEMKVINNKSKNNFYETEQDINVVTAKIRTAIADSTGDPTADVLNLVTGSSTGTMYTGERIAKLVYPTAGTNVYTDGNGNVYTFSGGNVTVTNKPGGDIVTLKDISVKRVDSDKLENTITTDIEFYIQKPVSGNVDVGVGDCSFLLDNSIQFNGSGVVVRANVYGSSIIGAYQFNGTSSTIKQCGVTLNASNEVASLTDASPAAINLNGNSYINFLAPYTCIFGDVVISDKALMNVYKGNFTVYGNIFVKGNGAFSCNGTLRLAPGCNIYYVDNSNNCTKITSKDLNHNIIIGSITYLSQTDYDNQVNYLNLNDNDPDNDGVLPSILVPATKDYAGNTINPTYCYELNKDNSSCEQLYMNGEQFFVKIPEQNFNGDYDHCLLFVPSGSESGLQENAPMCTIISKTPVKVSQTHNINLSQIGGDVFNYYLNNDYKFTCKSPGNGCSVKDFNVKDFFDPNCNDKVKSIFSNSIGSSGGAPAGAADTGVTFTNWSKF